MSGRNRADNGEPSLLFSDGGSCPPPAFSAQQTPGQQEMSSIRAELVTRQQEADAMEQQLRAQISALQDGQSELQSDMEKRDQAGSVAQRKLDAEALNLQYQAAEAAALERLALQQANEARTAEL